ncbi:hypothetical protein CWE08_02165 [Aliidiomarina iranensis]|uniref:Prepilin-type cleavage/methylation domain-containing protein n=1 Tax=Aliidiomarina iranensis TaxID=1434071 RepID=A0A432W2L0_9GAMM|nr:prepilin-type N-terminal cleavage/methylation domain-containing protein [Aliidiomarina iranensis]RUO23471.1 hypothetical protein CWE08_02165 [Aliidiomarina iranensis]
MAKTQHSEQLETASANSRLPISYWYNKSVASGVKLSAQGATPPPKYQRATGFTLVELVIVIVVLGILAVTAAPRIFGDRGVEESTLEPRILSMLRLQQQRAMQDTIQPCYGVTLTAAQLTPKDCAEPIAPERVLALPTPAVLTVISALPGADSGFLFNGLGCPVSNGHETIPEACGQSSVELQIDGVENRRICVQSQGYIRSGEC